MLAAAIAVGLLALVAVGSLRGPLGSGRGRPSYPADLVDSLVLLLFLAMLAAGVLAVISLWPDRRLGRRRRRGGTFSVLLPMAAVLLVWLLRDLLGLGGATATRPRPAPCRRRARSRLRRRRPSPGWSRCSWPVSP